MKLKFKHILLALIPCIMASACKKEEVPIFDSEMSGIIFQNGDVWEHRILHPDIYSDSTAFSFANAPLATMDTILSVRVSTMGKVRDYPRPVRFSIDQANSTAVEGKHFEIDYNSVVIPAGTNKAFIRVKIHRTADMFGNKLIVILKLEDNEHFKVYMEKRRNTSRYSGTAPLVYTDRFKFIISEIYTEPSFWRTSGRTYFGPWSVKKYKYVNGLLSWTDVDWTTGRSSGPVQLGTLNPAALIVRNALQALADAGTPMLDEDGMGMQLGANYQVRY